MFQICVAIVYILLCVGSIAAQQYGSWGYPRYGGYNRYGQGGGGYGGGGNGRGRYGDSGYGMGSNGGYGIYGNGYNNYWAAFEIIKVILTANIFSGY